MKKQLRKVTTRAKPSRTVLMQPPGLVILYGASFSPRELPADFPPIAVDTESPFFLRLSQFWAISVTDKSSCKAESAGEVWDWVKSRRPELYTESFDEAVEPPSVTWVGFRPQHLLEVLRLEAPLRIPRRGVQHLEDIGQQAFGVKPVLFWKEWLSLYSLTVPDDYVPAASAKEDLRVTAHLAAKLGILP